MKLEKEPWKTTQEDGRYCQCSGSRPPYQRIFAATWRFAPYGCLIRRMWENAFTSPVRGRQQGETHGPKLFRTCVFAAGLKHLSQWTMLLLLSSLRLTDLICLLFDHVASYFDVSDLRYSSSGLNAYHQGVSFSVCFPTFRSNSVLED